MNKKQAVLYRSAVIRSLVKKLRKKNTSKKALTEKAAIDIASLLIASIAVTTIGALIAATTIVIVPWAQDEAAKNQLKSVMAAQQVYAGMDATEYPNGQPVGSISALQAQLPANRPSDKPKRYGDLTDLIEAGLFDPAFKPDDAEDEIYGEQMLSKDKFLCVIKVEGGGGYETAILSQSGNIFAANETRTTPVKMTQTEAVCKGRVLGDYEDATGEVYIPPTPGSLEGGTNEPVEEETPTPSESPSPAPSDKPKPVTPDEAPEPPAQNKDPKTKEFMFCHHGEMHTNNFNGMINGHHGHDEDIMPPIPFKNYVGWNWNAETAKIFYNNCKPVN